MRRSAVPVELQLTGQHPIRLLGTAAALWAYRRR